MYIHIIFILNHEEQLLGNESKVLFYLEALPGFIILLLKGKVDDYSVVSIKRTGSLNYFEVFSHPVLFFHVLKKKFAPPCSFFHVLKKNFAPPCSLITSCSLNRYYRVKYFWVEIKKNYHSNTIAFPFQLLHRNPFLQTQRVKPKEPHRSLVSAPTRPPKWPFFDHF